MRGLTRPSLAVVVALCACGAACLWRGPILVGACRWLDVGEAPSCAEHVFVLPGEETYRPLLAAALVKGGLAGGVLIPQTDDSPDVTDGLRPPAADVVAAVVRHRGVLDENIVCLEAASRTTFDDAHALAAFLEQRPHDRVIVVTNAFHTRRARFIFRRVLGDNADRVRVVSAPNPGFAEETWWQNRFSANIVLAENLKLGFYFVRYSGLSSGIVSLLVILLVWRMWHTAVRPWRDRRSSGTEVSPEGRQTPA